MKSDYFKIKKADHAKVNHKLLLMINFIYHFQYTYNTYCYRTLEKNVKTILFTYKKLEKEQIYCSNKINEG